MRVDTGIPADLSGAGQAAAAAEGDGYDGIWTAETDHDPFLPLSLAAEHTQHIELGTAIAVAFARNPMTLAHTAYDLQAFSRGRFLLGLGTQIRPHITRRFSMPWSQPVARMRELVAAIHAIWDAWNSDGGLNFRGDFYSHTLMAPMFNPGPNPYGDPRIFLAGVGPRMTSSPARSPTGTSATASSPRATSPKSRGPHCSAGANVPGVPTTIWRRR